MRGHDGHEIVVVGAGAAGCVIARRLADVGRDVLLLEAGPDLRSIDQPDLHDGWRLPQTDDWGYESEADSRGQREPLRRVRGVGGTSWMTRFAVRGSPADFDAWARAGNDGWGFDAVLPFFRRLESDAEFGDRDWHGRDGPLPVTRYPRDDASDVHARTVDAAIRNGFQPVEDHNAPNAIGVGRMPMSALAGSRVTTADAYLPVGATPEHLELRADAEAASVLLEGARAVGVRLTDATEIMAETVVLAAGTYGSPTILMRSGIGPAQHLREVGVPVAVDLRGVGANLSDHPGVDIDLGWTGPATEPPILHSIATFRSARSGDADPPDLMFWVADPRGDPAVAEIDVVLMKPHSRGTVRLRSADPATRPRIDLPGVGDAADVERLAEGLRRAWEIATDDLVRGVCRSAPTALPSRASELETFVRANAYSIPHVVGTCAMGPAAEAGAVVDAAGRVHGVDGLLIVDASIIPDAPSGFPHLVTIMLAEAIAARSFGA